MSSSNNNNNNKNSSNDAPPPQYRVRLDCGDCSKVLATLVDYKETQLLAASKLKCKKEHVSLYVEEGEDRQLWELDPSAWKDMAIEGRVIFAKSRNPAPNHLPPSNPSPIRSNNPPPFRSSNPPPASFRPKNPTLPPPPPTSSKSRHSPHHSSFPPNRQEPLSTSAEVPISSRKMWTEKCHNLLFEKLNETFRDHPLDHRLKYVDERKRIFQLLVDKYGSKRKFLEGRSVAALIARVSNAVRAAREANVLISTSLDFLFPDRTSAAPYVPSPSPSTTTSSSIRYSKRLADRTVRQIQGGKSKKQKKTKDHVPNNSIKHPSKHQLSKHRKGQKPPSLHQPLPDTRIEPPNLSDHHPSSSSGSQPQAPSPTQSQSRVSNRASTPYHAPPLTRASTLDYPFALSYPSTSSHPSTLNRPSTPSHASTSSSNHPSSSNHRSPSTRFSTSNHPSTSNPSSPTRFSTSNHSSSSNRPSASNHSSSSNHPSNSDYPSSSNHPSGSNYRSTPSHASTSNRPSNSYHASTSNHSSSSNYASTSTRFSTPSHASTSDYPSTSNHASNYRSTSDYPSTSNKRASTPNYRSTSYHGSTSTRDSTSDHRAPTSDWRSSRPNFAASESSRVSSLPKTRQGNYMGSGSNRLFLGGSQESPPDQARPPSGRQLIPPPSDRNAAKPVLATPDGTSIKREHKIW